VSLFLGHPVQYYINITNDINQNWEYKTNKQLRELLYFHSLAWFSTVYCFTHCVSKLPTRILAALQQREKKKDPPWKQSLSLRSWAGPEGLSRILSLQGFLLNICKILAGSGRFKENCCILEGKVSRISLINFLKIFWNLERILEGKYSCTWDF
jgi:hypothetical protein